MKNFKKKDPDRKCFIDTDCINCTNINEFPDECLCNPNETVLIETLPACSCHDDCKCIHNQIAAIGRGIIRDADTNLEFNFNIIDNHGCLSGQLAIADYNSDILLSSHNILSYNQCTPCSFCAIFCDKICDKNRTQTRYITLYCLKEICGNDPALFVYSPPFCGVEEVSTGGSVDDGFIKIKNSQCC